MKRTILCATAIMVCLAVPCLAGDAGSALSKARAKASSVKLSGGAAPTTAIGGIRGAEQKEQDEIYWAGRDKVAKEELDMFSKGVSMVEKGDLAEGSKVLETFVRRYPESALLKEAADLLAELKK